MLTILDQSNHAAIIIIINALYIANSGQKCIISHETNLAAFSYRLQLNNIIIILLST